MKEGRKKAAHEAEALRPAIKANQLAKTGYRRLGALMGGKNWRTGAEEKPYNKILALGIAGGMAHETGAPICVTIALKAAKAKIIRYEGLCRRQLF